MHECPLGLQGEQGAREQLCAGQLPREPLPPGLAEEQAEIGGRIDVVPSQRHRPSVPPAHRPAVVFQHLQILPLRRRPEHWLQRTAAESRPDVDVLHVEGGQRGDRPPVLRDQDPLARCRLVDERGEVALQLVERYRLHTRTLPESDLNYESNGVEIVPLRVRRCEAVGDGATMRFRCFAPLRLRVAILTTTAVLFLPGLLAAGIITDAPAGSRDPTFHRRVQAALTILERSEDPPIRRLHAAVVASPATIMIRPITNDRATWHPDGDRTRGHTEPTDSRPRSEGRTKPTNAIIYVPPDAVEPGSAHWKNGLLVHELVHALDLASGHYHRDSTVRERRAVFLQNVWRARLGYKLRTAYHGRFATVDYQDASRRGTVDELVRYIFTGSDFPPPASAGHLEATEEND